MQRLADGLWRWTARHPEWHPAGFGDEVACFVLHAAEETILIDPLVPAADDDLAATLDGLVRERVRILITIPYHVRSCEQLRDRWTGDREVTIHGHALVGRRLADATGFHPLSPGDELPGGIRAHPLGRPRRAEMPLELSSHRAVAFGDAVVEADGVLHVWESPVDSERRRRWWDERFVPTLRAVAERPVERVLVTHGDPVLADGGAALASAVDRGPWQPPRG